MDPEKLNINFADGEGVKELIIREVDTVVEDKLPVLEPDKVEISGNITAIFAFLEKRWDAEDAQVNHCRTHILVDRDNLMMTLVVNETDKREKKTVVGTIQLSRQYTAFGINKKLWESTDLGNFFRINRSYFEKKETNINSYALIGALALAVIGGGWYFKVYKPKHEDYDDDDEGMEYDDSDEESDD